MRAFLLLSIIAVAIFVICYVQQGGYAAEAGQPYPGETIRLPAPSHGSSTSIEQALSERRSAREFKDEPLTLSAVSQLLWAAQGTTGDGGHRTTPSAGALYPLEVYVVAGNVEGPGPGVYKYLPREHAIVRVADGDRRADLSRAAMGQPAIRNAAIDIVIAGVYERTTGKYDTPLSDRRTGSDYPAGVKYVHMEAGHASQNVYLQCESLGLGTVAIGALSEDGVRKICDMPDDERPLYIMPVGCI